MQGERCSELPVMLATSAASSSGGDERGRPRRPSCVNHRCGRLARQLQQPPHTSASKRIVGVCGRLPPRRLPLARTCARSGSAPTVRCASFAVAAWVSTGQCPRRHASRLGTELSPEASSPARGPLRKANKQFRRERSNISPSRPMPAEELTRHDRSSLACVCPLTPPLSIPCSCSRFLLASLPPCLTLPSLPQIL